ncbi:MAG: YmdB family metallophosphoesterase [Candidatus Niyogibacteria bacterium]|nr:YmdB family metallophosphoesterase [Candidatus Niyogibacteria bacterium]
MRILFFGDVIGKAGRTGLARQLPLWRKKFRPDFVIVNMENAAHGFGVGRTQLQEIEKLGIDVMTGGNHILRGKNARELLTDEKIALLRPLNAPRAWPGKGIITKKIVGQKSQTKGLSNGVNETAITVVNLIGQHGMREHYNSPFEAIETVLKKEELKQNIIIVDWHAEASSEKVLLGWYLDGRVSAVIGTHTHIPTADERILPRGTAFISDAGMVGSYHSVIGVTIDSAFKKITECLPVSLEIDEEWPLEINAVMIDIEPKSKKAVGIKRLRAIVKK